MDIELVRVGNRESSSLILIMELPYSKLKLIPNINNIIKEYYVDDINTIYLTNAEELKKGLREGKALKFVKQ